MSSTSAKGDVIRSRTILWCVPRAISTAFAKCVSAIEGNEVWFEPYAYTYVAKCTYKKNTELDIPMEYEGNEEIFQTAKKMVYQITQSPMEADRLPYGSVKRRLEASNAKHVFVKDMTFGMPKDCYQYLPKGYRHTFLIRHPERFLLSYRKAIYKQFSEIGLLESEAADEKTYDLERDDQFFTSGYFVTELYDLWKYLKEQNIDPNPIIIDGDDLLTKPAEMLRAYCAEVGLPYSDSLLQWEESTEALKTMKAAGDNLLMDLVNFYGTAMKSSCFLPPRKMTPRDQLPPDVIRCSDEVIPLFNEMFKARLKV